MEQSAKGLGAGLYTYYFPIDEYRLILVFDEEKCFGVNPDLSTNEYDSLYNGLISGDSYDSHYYPEPDYLYLPKEFYT